MISWTPKKLIQCCKCYLKVTGMISEHQIKCVCGTVLPALTARSMSILLAARIVSFLSIKSSARWQIISLL